jgi:hypothetical protein
VYWTSLILFNQDFLELPGGVYLCHDIEYSPQRQKDPSCQWRNHTNGNLILFLSEAGQYMDRHSLTPRPRIDNVHHLVIIVKVTHGLLLGYETPVFRMSYITVRN